jgi:hypothetical protein
MEGISGHNLFISKTKYMGISEDFLQYVWKNRLFRLPLYLVTGEDVEVLDVGQHNHDSGPDFFNAKIRINSTLWAGNVEVHFKTSDWFMHGHHHDMNYQNIILHVVYHHDVEVPDYEGYSIPTAEMQFPLSIYDNYSAIIRNTEWIPCGESVRTIDRLIMNLWLDRLLAERMQAKAEDITASFAETKGNWKETIYRQLARNFGFKLNSMPFSLLSKSLPYKYLERYSGNPVQAEALLFGQAGMLDPNENDENSTGRLNTGGTDRRRGNVRASEDEYFRELKSEYGYLRKKYNLRPIAGHLWRFLRLRPANFPTIRIAQFASLVVSEPSFPADVLELDPAVLRSKLLNVRPSAYWDDHYLFNRTSVKRSKQLGEQAVHNIIINTLIPVYFEYGRKTGSDSFRQKAIGFLETLPPESNNITRGWESSGISVTNAFYSQSLLQLKNNYCNLKKCLFCQVGNQIIR